MTAHAGSADLAAALDAGADDALAEPVERDVLSALQDAGFYGPAEVAQEGMDWAGRLQDAHALAVGTAKLAPMETQLRGRIAFLGTALERLGGGFLPQGIGGPAEIEGKLLPRPLPGEQVVLPAATLSDAQILGLVQTGRPTLGQMVRNLPGTLRTIEAEEIRRASVLASEGYTDADLARALVPYAPPVTEAPGILEGKKVSAPSFGFLGTILGKTGAPPVALGGPVQLPARV